MAGFLQFLLTDEEQGGLSALGALPVTRTAAPAYADALLTALDRAYTSPFSPAPFAYQAQREALINDALRALGGDAAAKASFWQRMAVVECGEL